MTQYRNTGAHFQRADGSWVGRDIVFEPTPEELAQYSYKLKSEPDRRAEATEAPEVSTEESSMRIRRRPQH